MKRAVTSCLMAFFLFAGCQKAERHIRAEKALNDLKQANDKMEKSNDELEKALNEFIEKHDLEVEND